MVGEQVVAEVPTASRQTVWMWLPVTMSGGGVARIAIASWSSSSERTRSSRAAQGRSAAPPASGASAGSAPKKLGVGEASSPPVMV